MEEVLRGWLGEQEDQIEDLKEHLAQKQRELVRLTQVEEEEEVAGSKLHAFLPEEQRAATKEELRTVLGDLQSYDQAPPPALHTLRSLSTSFLREPHAPAKLKEILHSLTYYRVSAFDLVTPQGALGTFTSTTSRVTPRGPLGSSSPPGTSTGPSQPLRL